MSALKQSVKRHLRAVKDHLGLSTHADIKEAQAELAALLRAEYTVMPRFGFHQPLDYQMDTLPPKFDASVKVTGEPLVLPPPEDRMGYPADNKEYLEWGGYDADLIRKQVTKQLQRETDIAILDFGCSSGRVLRHFYGDMKERDWKLYGVDIQARPIEWMRQNFPQEMCVCTCTTMPHLPFADNSLDAIYGISVFTHVKFLWDLWLMELRRVLKPGGVLIQTIHTENAWNFYIKHKHEDWVRQNHTPIVFDSARMEPDYLYYGDMSVSQVFWKREIAMKFWGRYLNVLEIRDPPEKYSFQDWVIATKA